MEVENMSSKDGGDGDLLPGFRFHPIEEELVEFYLRRKVEKKPIRRLEFMEQLTDIYKYDPWDLPRTSRTIWDNGSYFEGICGRSSKRQSRRLSKAPLNGRRAKSPFQFGVDIELGSRGSSSMGLPKAFNAKRGVKLQPGKLYDYGNNNETVKLAHGIRFDQDGTVPLEQYQVGTVEQLPSEGADIEQGLAAGDTYNICEGNMGSALNFSGSDDPDRDDETTDPMTDESSRKLKEMMNMILNKQSIDDYWLKLMIMFLGFNTAHLAFSYLGKADLASAIPGWLNVIGFYVTLIATLLYSKKKNVAVILGKFGISATTCGIIVATGLMFLTHSKMWITFIPCFIACAVIGFA